MCSVLYQTKALETTEAAEAIANSKSSYAEVRRRERGRRESPIGCAGGFLL
jgi:hypothetical protein